ncbi:MAG: signal peptidase II [Propionibacteriaceae bacterium]|jgi:signal peptidase II|nr:signal peptidase II [Propionibacteriaceae bacterium]
MRSALTRRGSILTILGVVAIGLVVDQVTKWLAIEYLKPGQRVAVVGDLLELSLYRNPGAAFSLVPGLTMVLSILATVVVIAICVFVLPRVRSRICVIATGLGLAGVTGNLIDRLIREPGPFRGHVIDFLSLKWFAVFNVADMCLTAAAIMIVIIVVFLRIDLTGEPTATVEAVRVEAE